MEHVAGSQNGALVSAAAGLSQPLLRAPDKYLSSYLSDDLNTYICSYSGSSAWVMGEFMMLFDPNSTDGRYYQSSLLFKVYGIVNSTIELGGDFRFTTKPDEGYGFAGSTKKIVDNPGSDAKKFLAGSAKFLGQFNKLSDQVSVINSKAKEASDALKDKTGVLGGIKQIADNIFKNTGGSSLKSVLGVASSVSGIFGVVGSVAGLLWPSDDKPTTVTPAPTVSSGSIKLTGTIETTTVIGSTSTEEPGTPHNFDGNTNAFSRASQPYYDCPMGLFNLRQTPQLARVVYPRAKLNSGNRGEVPEESYTSYSVQEDLTPVFNQTSGMEVLSVKAAIVQKVRYSSLVDAYDNPSAPTRYNYLYEEVQSGNLEAVPFDNGPTPSPEDDTYLVQTPLVDVGCFKGMAFNAPTDSLVKSPAFIRVIAALRRVGALTSDAPYYFVQDYAFDAVDPSPSNPPRLPSSSYLDKSANTPYSLGNVSVIGGSPYFDDVVQDGLLYTRDNTLFVSATSNYIFTINSYVSFIQQVRNRDGTTTTNVIDRGGFRAGNSVSFQGDLMIQPGTDAYVTTDPLYYRPCTNPNLRAQAMGSCNPYNPWATTTVQAPPTTSIARKVPYGTGVAAATIQLAPNPATQSTTVSLISAGAEPSSINRVEVLNLSGQPVWQAASLASTTVMMEIPLRGLSTGLYMVRVTTTSRSYVEKLVVQ